MIFAVSWNKLKLVCHKGLFFPRIADHRDAKQFSKINSLYLFFWRNRWSFKSVSAFIAISFIQYPVMMSPENANLNKIKLITLINFKFKFQCILFYILFATSFSFMQYKSNYYFANSVFNYPSKVILDWSLLLSWGHWNLV